jgi:hypothetical protein
LNTFDEIDKAFGQAEAAKPMSGGFTPLPEGTRVRLAVIDQRGARVGQNQTPVCKVTFEVMEPAADFRGEWDPSWKGRKVWHDLWITPANVSYLKRDLNFLGWTGKKVSALMDASDSSLMALGAEAVLGVESYEDKNGNTAQKNVVRFFTGPWTPPVSDAEMPEPSAEDVPF